MVLSQGELMSVRLYDNKLLLADVSGAFLWAIVRRNAHFAGRADFLYCDGVTFELRAVDEKGAFPFTLPELTAGALECVAASVRVHGVPLRASACWQNQWYRCVFSDYVLNTILADVPERKEGVRRVVEAGCGEREVICNFVERGGELAPP